MGNRAELEGIVSPAEAGIEEDGRQETTVWQHWSEFEATWELSQKSRKTVKNVRESLRLADGHGGLATLEAWADAGRAFRVLHELRERRRWSATTFNSHRKNANTYFAFLVRKGHIETNPVRRIEKMREWQRNYALPTKADFLALMGYLRLRRCTNALERRRNLLFFQLLAET